MKKLTLLLLLLGASVSAQNQKISDLTSGSPVQATDMIPIARGAANFRLAGSDFLSSAGGTFTNQLLGPASATTPSFSFTGDTSTGISRPFSGMVGLLAGGNTSIYASSTGGFSNFTFTVGAATTNDRIKILPVAMGSGTFDGSITSVDLTAARTWTFPNATGDVPVLAANGLFARTAAQTFAARTITASAGGAVTNGDGVSGNPTVGPDLTTTPQFSSGTGDVPATGAVGTFYAETDANSFYTYPSTDTEHWLLSIAAGQTAGRLFQTSATDVLAEITPTDETVLVSNGTTWEKKTLPDCDDTGGNHLNYDTGTNVFSCGTSGGGTFDPSITLEMYEEFLAGETSTSQEIGSNGWGSALLGTGTIAGDASAAEHPGVIRFNSHATNDNSGGELYLNHTSNNTGTLNWTILSSNDWDVEAVFLPGANSTSIANVGIYFGFSTTNFSTAGDGAWIRYDTDYSDATYFFQICNASGAAGCQAAADGANNKVTASTKAPAAGTWNRFKIRRRTSGVGGNPTWYFSVGSAAAMETEKTFCSSGCDDTLGTLTTSSQNGMLFVGYITRTTTGVISGDVDYVYLTMSGLVRY